MAETCGGTEFQKIHQLELRLFAKCAEILEKTSIEIEKGVVKWLV